MINLKIEQKPMTFTSELFEKVISAILCSYKSQTIHDERQNALKFLEDLKENHPIVCLTISLELLKQTDNQAILHHYSLHLLESIIKHQWNILKSDERNLIKRQLIFILSSTYLHQIFMDPVHIRNSLAKCFVEMIKRDCFEKSNTTLDEIINIIQGIVQIQGWPFSYSIERINERNRKMK